MIQKTYPAILFLIMLHFSAQGQFKTNDLGVISKNEIEMTKCSFDEDAEAVVLFDKAKAYFIDGKGDFNIVFERTTRIKILSEAGIKWSEIEIPFYSEGGIHEKVYDIEAASYNLEDRVLKKTSLNLMDMYEEKRNEYWKVKKFAIPEVKAGSIIEYRYTIYSPYKFNLRDWEFQWRIPVVYSEYEIRMIPFYEYSWILQGAEKFDSQISYVYKGAPRTFGKVKFQDMLHSYVMKNVPAFKSEEFITSINDYIIKLDFQLSKIIYPDGYSKKVIPTWEAMNKEFLKSERFGKYMRKSEKIAGKLIKAELTKLKTPEEKFNFVIDYVKNNFNWNNSYDKYASKTPQKFVKDKYGNCADINLFTVGMLNAAGIDAKPVLVSTRRHGKIKYDYPYTHFFNYVLILANVEGRNILSDATNVWGLNKRIWAECINDKGMIVQKNKTEWVNLEVNFPSEIKTEISMKPENNELISAVSVTATEYDATAYRYELADKTKEIKADIETGGSTVIENSISVQNQNDRDKPYILKYKQKDKLDIINEKIYLSPFLNKTISENLLKQETRNYPVDFIYPKKRIFTTSIEIPKGYQVDYLPKASKFENDLFEMAYTASAGTHKIIISFSYYFKKAVYAPSDYAKIRLYLDDIVAKGNDKIVLTRTVK